MVAGVRGELGRDRRRMVDRLREEGITDLALLHAFDTVPRHRFVPEALRHSAYAVAPLPIGHGQTISSPVIHGLSLQLAEIQGEERVLEVGTGSGFQTALLAELGARVYSIERLEPLAARARAVLASLGYEVRIEVGDGTEGWAEQAPFDAIIVSAAAARLPGALLAQLADGGRLVVPVGEADQALYRIVRRGGEFERERISGARFVPLIAEGGEPGVADGWAEESRDGRR